MRLAAVKFASAHTVFGTDPNNARRQFYPGGSDLPFPHVHEHEPEGKRTYILTRLNVHSNLLRLIRDGGKCVCVGGGEMGTYVLTPTRYTVPTRMTLHYGGQLCETF